MTKVTVLKNNGYITKFEALGHSEFDDYGKDILCASISTSLQSLALGVIKVLNIKAKYIVKENTGYFLLELPNNLEKSELEQTQLLFNVCVETLKDIQKGYPKNISLEVKEDVY